jgi:NADH:ubiquinone reductase (H+-translocating)
MRILQHPLHCDSISVMATKKIKKCNVVIAGGGFAGVQAALKLANKPGISVTLVSASAHFEYHGALYRTATGHSPREVMIPLEVVFAHAENVDIILDRVTGIVSQKRVIQTEHSGVIAYDELVCAFGNVPNYFGINGLKENSASIDTLASAVRLRHQLQGLFRAQRKQRAKILVVGAGPAGVEVASEIQSYANFIALQHGLKSRKVKVDLVDGMPRVLPAMDEKVSKKVMKRLSRLGVKVHLNEKVNDCLPGQLCLANKRLNADLIIWTAGSTPVGIYKQYPDLFDIGRGGRVVVNEQLQSKDPHIYVVGDNALTPYAGMAKTAIHDGEFVAKCILRLQNDDVAMTYTPKKCIYSVPVGYGWAVVQDGDKIFSGYRGWLFRRRTDLEILKSFEPYEQAISDWNAGKHRINVGAITH